jgi:hypothetical protein
VGEALRSGTPDTGKGPSRRFGAFARSWDARQATETLWTLSGTTQRTAIGPGEALPSRQEGRLNPHEDGERGSFAMYIKPIAKLLVVKTQA